MIGSLQALEALKLLAGRRPLTDAFLQVDLARPSTFLRVSVAPAPGLPGLCGRVGCRAMLGIGTLRRVAGELRRDVRAAYERDPAAKGVSAARSSPPGRACTRCSRTASRTRCTRPACRSPRARSPTSRAR